MAEKMLMLALSPTMEEGTIISWSKKEGDTVAAGDIVCEVETDKATMDYESLQAGTILKILVQEGNSARVEQAIAIVGESGENIDDLLKEITKAASEPAVGETSGGETAVRETAPGADVAREAAPAAAAARETAPGANIAGETTPAAAVREPAGKERLKASPLARNMAAEAGIDLSVLNGSGPDGRIVKQDVETVMEHGVPFRSAPGISSTAGTAAVERGTAFGSGSATGIVEEHIPVSRKRAVIARRLAESKFSAPHYYLGLSVLIDNVLESRDRLNSRRAKGEEPKLSLNAFLIKMTAEAIKRHPIVNAGWEESEIHVFGSVDIGLAVALEDGLITPIVRNCGAKGIIQIDRELRELIRKAKSGKLTPEEYTGATFSISNLGSYGIEEFTAIINPPASAILAVGTAVKQPKELEDGSIKFHNTMKITLSCDHRVIDGAVGAEFLRTLKAVIEDPLNALL